MAMKAVVAAVVKAAARVAKAAAAAAALAVLRPVPEMEKMDSRLFFRGSAESALRKKKSKKRRKCDKSFNTWKARPLPNSVTGSISLSIFLYLAWGLSFFLTVLSFWPFTCQSVCLSV